MRKPFEFVLPMGGRLGELDSESVRVELYAEGLRRGTPVRQQMTRIERLSGSTNRFLYAADVQASRPWSDFTPRLMPFHAGALPLEALCILWYAGRQ